MNEPDFITLDGTIEVYYTNLDFDWRSLQTMINIPKSWKHSFIYYTDKVSFCCLFSVCVSLFPVLYKLSIQ